MHRRLLLLPSLLLLLRLLGARSASPTAAAFDDRCCMPGQPTSGFSSCSGDAFCAGPGACKRGGSFHCGTDPDIECQNCGCCPCCDVAHACCPEGDSDYSNARPRRSSFRTDVLGEPSPSYNKGVCKPVCDPAASPTDPPALANCYGHGACVADPQSCPQKKCACDPVGFDPDQGCATCRQTNWGPNCTECPGIVPGTEGASSPCSGHGACNGMGTTTGTGVCSCMSDWTGATCATFWCPKGCVHGQCVLQADGIHTECICEHGWTDATCETPKCPTKAAPDVPGCVHGNCSLHPEVSHCNCEVSRAIQGFSLLFRGFFLFVPPGSRTI